MRIYSKLNPVMLKELSFWSNLTDFNACVAQRRHWLWPGSSLNRDPKGESDNAEDNSSIERLEK